MKVLSVFGTRPEAIKMAPLILALRAQAGIAAQVCVTAQHRQMLDPVLRLFGIAPDYDLDIMKSGQSLADVAGRIMIALDPVLTEARPDLVLVHGDTATTIAAALAAYYRRIDVGHVEAGLRTGDLLHPWPEEGNRKLTGAIARWHFAPTPEARDNLLREGVPSADIYVTGNTVIDALKLGRSMLAKEPERAGSFPVLRAGARLVLVTCHRRENFGEGFRRICEAIRAAAATHLQADFLYPVHLNPQVSEPVKALLGGLANVHLIAPQEYLPFVHLMGRAHLILTDSGGIQEETISLGTPCLVMRDATERPEALQTGLVELVGTAPDRIARRVSVRLAAAKPDPRSLPANPYGDGEACKRIAAAIRSF